MLAVVQRVTNAAVSVSGTVCGSCEQGLMILLGVCDTDTEADVRLLCDKLVKLRIFYDGEGVKNLSLLDIDGEALVVSNFTLCANYRSGNRPDYHRAAPPERARVYYELFVETLRKQLRRVETGTFGAYMQISAALDGPVTLVLDSAVLAGPRRQA